MKRLLLTASFLLALTLSSHAVAAVQHQILIFKGTLKYSLVAPAQAVPPSVGVYFLFDRAAKQFIEITYQNFAGAKQQSGGGTPTGYHITSGTVLPGGRTESAILTDNSHVTITDADNFSTAYFPYLGVNDSLPF
ncbi:MAG: hypothetical protein QOD99_3112, partial [Chthoniobacter sp.]|nr:hypothetical protein [Chthoniobacter sp.]